MNKIRLLVILAVLLFVMSALPALASPVSDLSALARFYPIVTSFYAAQRVDDAYITSVDNLLTKVDNQVGGMLLNGSSLRQTLDTFPQQFGAEGDFESVIGGWLGDTIAVGITDLPALVAENREADQPIVIALAVDDAAAAEAFLDEVLLVDYMKQELNEGILYRPGVPSYYSATLLLLPDALLMRPSSIDALSLASAFDASLADSQDFGAALGRLPREDYDSLMYFDLSALAFMGPEIQAQLERENFPFDIDFGGMFAAMGPQAAGGAIVDGTSLIMDVAFHIRDLEGYMGSVGGMSAAMTAAMQPGSPLSMEFTNRIPAGTLGFVQMTDLGPRMLANLAQAEALGNRMEERAAAGQLTSDQEGMQYIDDMITFMRLSWQGLAGMSLEDAAGWMTGDAAAFIGVMEGTSQIPLLPNLGWMVAVTDEDAASALMQAVPQLLFELGLETEMEGETTVLPLFGAMLGDERLDLLMANDGSVLVSGTRPGVEAVLSGSGGAAQSAAFQTASALFLAEPHMLAYLDGAQLYELARVGATLTGDSDLADLSKVLAILGSASITAHHDDAAGGSVRFALTLSGG